MNSYQDHNFKNSNYSSLYYERLYSLDIDFEFISIETSFCDTTVISTGIQTCPPLVLVHDSSSCAPIALSQHAYLAKYFKVFAIDVLVEEDRNENRQMSLKNDDYGKWMYEILSRLQLVNATLFGISFGGYVALKALIYNTDRIKYAILYNVSGMLKQNRLWRIKNSWIYKYVLGSKDRKPSYATPAISGKMLSNIKTPVSFLFSTDNKSRYPENLKKTIKDYMTTLDEIIEIKSQNNHQEYALIEKIIREKFKNV